MMLPKHCTLTPTAPDRWCMEIWISCRRQNFLSTWVGFSLCQKTVFGMSPMRSMLHLVHYFGLKTIPMLVVQDMFPQSDSFETCCKQPTYTFAEKVQGYRREGTASKIFSEVFFDIESYAQVFTINLNSKWSKVVEFF